MPSSGIYAQYTHVHKLSDTTHKKIITKIRTFTKENKLEPGGCSIVMECLSHSQPSFSSVTYMERKKERRKRKAAQSKAKQNKTNQQKSQEVSALVTFPVAVIKYPNINNFVEKEFILAHNFVMFCLSHFLIAVTKHHDQVNLQKTNVYLGLQFQRVSTHNGKKKKKKAWWQEWLRAHAHILIYM